MSSGSIALRAIQNHLSPGFRALFSDIAGNDERLAFFYDSSKVKLLEKVGEVAIPPSQKRHVKFPGIKQKFDGFDRNPYLAAFSAGSFRFVLVNVHLFYGSESPVAMSRRSLETYQEFTGQLGVFDFDGALFKTLWETRGLKDFLAYLRYYISDHRLLWAEFRI